MTAPNRLAQLDRSLAVLTKAYLDGTLRHGDCAACAVGNLVAAAMSLPVSKERFGPAEHGDWFFLVAGLPGMLNDPDRLRAATAQIAATGYEVEELERIESAFEVNSGDATGYAGLLRVCDVLLEIHGVADGDPRRAAFAASLKPEEVPA